MPADLTVDVATPDDVPGIARVMRGVADEGRWIGTPPGTGIAALEARFAAMVDDPGAHTLVLRGGGDVVGVASLTREHVRGAHGVGMSIAGDWRRRGGGGLLLDGLLAHAATNPAVHKVELQVWPRNGGAIALYVSRGFVVEGVLRDHWRRPDGALWSSVLMGWWPPRAG
jgi:RimJ/RimL family protein N-acetyltransferase